MLEAELASIAKAIVDISGIHNIEFEEVSDGFKRPSLFFPPVEQDGSTPTFDAFAFDNSLYAKVFDQSAKKATDFAAGISFGLLERRLKIPLLNEEGLETGGIVRLTSVSHKSIDSGSAQIYIRWKSVYETTKETHTKAKALIRQIGLK